MKSSTLVDDVTCLIKKETETTLALINLLQQEKHALCIRDTEALNQCVIKKAKKIGELEQLARQRIELLACHGFDNNSEGWRNLIDTLAEDGQDHIIEAWQVLEKVARRSYNLNQVNGKIVNRTKQTVQKLLNIIRGQPDSLDLYDQMGRSNHRSNTSSAPIVQA